MRFLILITSLLFSITTLAGSGTRVAGCSAHEAISSLLKREGMTYFTVGSVTFRSATMVADRALAEITYRNVEPVQREEFILHRESLGGIDCFYAERAPVKPSPATQRPRESFESAEATGVR